MSVHINRSDTNITVAFPFTLPPTALNTVTLDFISEYDRQEHITQVEVVETGDFLVAQLQQDQLPRRDGNYTLRITDTLTNFLTLRDIHQTLMSLNTPLNNIMGPARGSELGRINAYINTESTMSSAEARNSGSPQPTERLSTIIQPTLTSNTSLQPSATAESGQAEATNPELQSI